MHTASLDFFLIFGRKIDIFFRFLGPKRPKNNQKMVKTGKSYRVKGSSIETERASQISIFTVFLSKTGVLQPKKGLFCTILHIFGEFLVNCGRILPIFAFSCMILLIFAVNFPKHHPKNRKMTVKMAKNGLKMALKWSKNSPKRPQNAVKTTPKRAPK